MVSRARLWVLAATAALSLGCSLVNATSDHTARYGTDGGALDASRSEPIVRVVHLARDTGAVDVYLDGTALPTTLAFTDVSAAAPLPTGGSVTVRITQAGSSTTLVEQTFPIVAGHGYTLVFYGDEVAPPFDPPRTLALLLLDDVSDGLDAATDERLAVVHVASPVIAGQLVAVRAAGNTVLARDFGFTAVARLDLVSMAYTVGFDAGADGVVDVAFDVPPLVPGTYANVFVAARADGSVFLLVTTLSGARVLIDANRV